MDRQGIDVPRLCIAMHRSRWMLERYRQNRREMVRQLVGANYSEEGAREPVPLPLISLYQRIVTQSLVAKEPRVMLRTHNRSAGPTVHAMQTWANREFEHMQLANTFQRSVIDSLYSIGIIKVALATPSDAALYSWQLVAGAPFAKCVDFDDFVIDAHARDISEAAFVGHRYRVPLDTVRDSNLYTKARKQLVESTDQPYNVEGDERIGMIGRGYREMQTEEFEPMVDLWEVYLPRHRLVVTLADEWVSSSPQPLGTDEGLRIQRWIGPPAGPYHFLGLGVVPGNLMPTAPIQGLIDLHDDANLAYRKISRTAARIKEILTVEAGQDSDGDRFRTANDGDVVTVRSPDAAKPIVQSGGAVQVLLALMTTFKDFFSFFAGNLDIMGGLSPQSKTAHQDAMLNQNSQRSIADMQQATIAHVGGVTTALCWYYHHDPVRVQRSSYALPSVPELRVTRQVTPAQRQQIPWEDIELRVDPYSLVHKTPQDRLSSLLQIVQQVFLPMAQLMQAQGIVFDMNTFLKKMGQYMDEPDIVELFTIQEPPAASPQGGGQQQAPKPAVTSRIYTRQNMPGRTREGNDRDMVARMLGHNLGGSPDTSTNGTGGMKP